MKHEIRCGLAVAAIYLVAALAYTWPLALHLDDRILGYVGFENTGQTLWLYAEWKAYVLAAARQTVLAHPLSPTSWGELCWTVTSFSAKVSMANGIDFALTLPLESIFGVAGGYNVKCLLILVTNALGGYALVFGLGGRRSAAVVGGAVFAFNPFSFYQLLIGRVIETILFPLPLYALCLWKAWHSNESGLWEVGAGIAFGLATLIYWFNGHFLLVFTLLFAFYQLGARPPRDVLGRIGKMLLIAVIALAVILPAAVPYCVLSQRGERLPGDVREDPGTSHQRSDRLMRQLLQWSCDADYGLRPPTSESHAQERLDPPWRLPTINTFDAVLTAAGLLAIGFVPGSLRFWSVAVVALYLLPLGPFLKLGGQRIVLFDHYIPLPYLWMVDNLPLLDRLFFPTQSMGLWAMAVGTSVGLALSRLAPSHERLAVGLGLGLIVASAGNMAWRQQLPLPATEVAVLETYRSEGGGFIYLPTNLKYWDGDASFNREMYVEPDLKHVDFHMALHGRKSLWGRNQYLAGKDLWMFQPETAAANSFLRFLIYADRHDDVYTDADLAQMCSAGLQHVVLSERLCSHAPRQGDYVTDLAQGAARFDEMSMRLQKHLGPPVEDTTEVTWEKFQGNDLEIRPQRYRIRVFKISSPSAIP